MRLFHHYFSCPLPYQRAWLLQQKIYELQRTLGRSMNHDVLLLLEHRPTYTAGRRQTEGLIDSERKRLTALGADFVTATRGGQMTYHGPGQIVGYPLLDLSRYNPTMGARDYVCRIQKSLQSYLTESHGIPHIASDNTGVFLDPTTKIASIGVAIRHRLTSHGFAINVTKEPRPWFDQIVACGLEGVVAGSVETALGRSVNIDLEVPKLVHQLGVHLERDMIPLDIDSVGELQELLLAAETDAEQAGLWNWPEAPRIQPS